MRDQQRQRVYDAERRVPSSPIGTGSMNEVTEFAASVVGSAWWRKRCGVRVVHVKDGRGRVNACAYGNTIKLPRWARSKMVVLHELAHVLNDSGGAPHGREFAAAFLALVDRFGEPGDGKLLREGYAAKRVKWRGAAPTVNRMLESRCTGCDRCSTQPHPWRVKHASLSTGRFCTRRCAEQWFAARLVRSEIAAAVRG